MNDKQSQDNGMRAERLFDFGDLLAAGVNPAPRDDLEATAARVQRALRANAPDRQRMPAELKSAIWEDLMQSTAASASSTPMNPWLSAQEHRAAPAVVVPGRGQRRPQATARWSLLANVALAIVIVLAGLGAYRGLGGFERFSGPNVPVSMPDVSMHVATPEPATTDTTESITACDLSGNIPIIPDVTENQAPDGSSPIGVTSLYVVHEDRAGINASGTLMLGCPGEESVELAENVRDVWSGPWKGTVSVTIMPLGTDDLSAASRSIVEIVTGETVALGEVSFVSDSPWVIGAAPEDPDILMVIDLRTMEARPFEDVAGVAAPAADSLLYSTPADDGTLAVGFMHPYGDDLTSGTLMTDTGAPGDLLILGASFDETRWIAIPESLPRISAVTLSPDGSHAAVVSMGEGESFSESYKYGVINLNDGSVVGSSEDIPYLESPLAAWIQNGDSIAYHANTELQTLSIEGDGQPETVFEAESQLSGLKTTWDPDVIVAATRFDHGSDAPSDQTARDAVFAVNVETGVVNEFAGIDVSAMAGWITDAGALVMYDWDDAHPDTMTYRVFDPVSGDQIGTIADAPTVQPKPRTLPTIGPNSIAVSGDGRVEVIALGTQHVYAFTAGSSGVTMERVASPDGLLANVFLTGNVILSPDGTLLSLTGEEDEGRTRHLISLTDPSAEWISLPNNVPGERGRGLISFAAGTGG